MGWIRSTRNELARIKRHIGGGRFTIELADGGRRQFAREETARLLFMHHMYTLRAIYHEEECPPPPLVFLTIAGASDRERAFYTAFPDGEPLMPYEAEPLIERGEFVARPLAGHELEEAS